MSKFCCGCKSKYFYIVQAYKHQFMSGFKAAETDEGGYNPNAKIIEEEKKRKDGKKSRWE